MEKHKPREKDKHHRQNIKSGTRAYPIIVDKKKHQFFHALFGSKNVYQIVQDLNERWISPEFIIKVERRTNETH